MPPTTTVERGELLALIRAAIRWIDTPGPEAARKASLQERLKQQLAVLRGKVGSAHV